MIIGCGTGRCGTMSLAALLEIPHEMYPILPWEVDEDLFYRKMKKVQVSGGDVCLSYINYIPYLVENFKAKIVCMKRDREETIVSYDKKVEDQHHWINHDGTKWRHQKEWDEAYPKFELLNRTQCIGAYWDLYYKKIEEFKVSYPSDICVFNVDCFNSKEGQDSIFDFLKIKKEYKIGIKENSYENRHISKYQKPH